MAPTNKARASGVSASSFMDLKAELAKKEEDFARNKTAGKSAALVGGVKRPDKKPTVWARHNQGVDVRASRDIELEIASKQTFDTARATLERKAQIYEKLRKGKTGGLSEAQQEILLVDFESKAIDAYELDSDDVDESLTVPKASQDGDDPIVEYEDEFGRIRTGRRSDIPRHLLKDENEEEEEEEDPFVIYNPQGHFPIYQPSEERLAEIKAEFSEENNPLNIHYDASHEVRAKGAAFYQFSGDEETRRKQMEELRKAREETEKTRQEAGAVNVLPGEVEGMIASEDPSALRSRALEKRKREIEERRRLIEAKRRKKNPEPASLAGASASLSSTTLQLPELRLLLTPSPGPHLPGHEPEQLGSQLRNSGEGGHDASASAPLDPFAMLEAQGATTTKGKGKAVSARDSADAFLASLEKDILQGGKR